MQSHLGLILLVELHTEELQAEVARRQSAHQVNSLPGFRLCRRLAATLVSLALWLDRQATAAGVEATLTPPRRLQGHV